MLQLFKLAFRDLARNRRRSFFSALALGMGLALLLLMASVVAGEMRDSMESSIRLQSGHLQVRAQSYNEDKTSLAWQDLVADPEGIAAKIAALAPVEVAAPRLYASGILVKGDASLGVRLMGIQPASSANAPYRNGMVSGAFLAPDDRDGLLIGQPLADKLHLAAGDTVELLANTSDGGVNQQTFTVRGTYTTHTPAFDQSTAFLTLAKAQAITDAGDHASIIFVLLKDRDQADQVAAALQSSQYQVLTFKDTNALLDQTEQLANAYMMVLYLIVLAITATVIVNTLIMSVYERTREIGILSAIGMRSGSIMGLFFAESSLLAVGGIVIGLILGSLLVAYATHYGFYIGNISGGISGFLLGERIYAYLTPSDTILLTIITFIVTLLAGVYPAVLAARLEPVAALRGEK